MIYSILLAIALAAFGFLAWRDLRSALILLLGLLPTYLMRFSIGPLPTTLLEGCFIITTIVCIMKRPLRDLLDFQRPFPWNRPLLLILAAACFAASISPNLFAALGVWKAFFIEPAILFLMLRATFKEEKDWMDGLNALFISGCVVATFAIFQRVSGGVGIPAPWDLELRTTSFFSYPNAAGLFLAPLVSGAIVALSQSKSKPTSYLLPPTLLILLAVPALYFCQTEAAYIAVPAGLFLAFLFSSAPKKQKVSATLATLVTLAALATLSPTVREKLTLSDTSGITRRVVWSETINMLKDHPIFGAGLSGYPTAMEPYHATGYYEIFQYPHNIVLNIWSELGLLGLLGSLGLGMVTIRTMMRNPSPLHLIAFAALATMVVHGLVDVPYFKNDLSMMTWFFLAMMSV